MTKLAVKLDGNIIAAQILSEVKQDIKKFGLSPSLAVVLMGDNPASEIYIRKKQEACDSVGIKSVIHHHHDTINLVKCLNELNQDKSVHGVLLQLPLPNNLYKETHFLTQEIVPEKDVDVLHPENIGLLVQGRPRFKPCTPHGIQQLLKRNNISVVGKHVLVINRSDIVGRPLSSMLIQDNDEYANATVTVCHDRSDQNAMKKIAAAADVIVVAVGQPNFLTPDFVKPGAIVIDVGINRIKKNERTVVVGDVHPDVWEIAGYVSPVPGGCGVITVACLLQNTVLAAKMLSGLL